MYIKDPRRQLISIAQILALGVIRAINKLEQDQDGSIVKAYEIDKRTEKKTSFERQ